MVSCLPLPKFRYKRRNSFRHHPRNGTHFQVHHPPSPDSTGDPPSILEPVAELPVELWLEIIHNVRNARVLAQLMRVSRVFHAATEPILYHNVSLETDNTIVLFSHSLSWSPHRSRLVHGLTVSTLVTTPHSLSTPLEPLRHWGQKGCQAVLSADYPALRTFTSNLSGNLVIPFLRRHTRIEELHLVGYSTLHPHTWPSQATTGNFPKLHSLRSLTCPPRLLDGVLDLPLTLTHLSLMSLHSKLFLLSPDFQSIRGRLVSLRVRLSRYCRRPHAFRPVTFDDVIASFPSLRYLQVDMNYDSKPHDLRNHDPEALLHWTAKRDPDHHRTTAHRLTVAWIYPYPFDRGVDMIRAAKWHISLKEVAYELLLEWDHLVERIVFRHTIIPYLSVSLNECRTGLVCVQERQMMDDYWNTI